MNKFGFMAVVIVLALLVLGLKYGWIWRRHKRHYQRIQADRAVLPDADFCREAGLEVSAIDIVSIIRAKLAERGGYDPRRIYPGDAFYPYFGLDYDDDAASFVQELKIIEGGENISFPLEEVKTTADFIRVVLRLKAEVENVRAAPH